MILTMSLAVCRNFVAVTTFSVPVLNDYFDIGSNNNNKRFYLKLVLYKLLFTVKSVMCWWYLLLKPLYRLMCHSYFAKDLLRLFTDIAGIITFCTAFGILCSNMGERGRIMLDFFTCLNEIIMRLVGIVMW